ncbi:MAG TPA: TrmH family RNA methyltransferase [Myxococcota bacterium]|nr:TrmH family RNA methyltransferase [Myxococcota bacterium]
MNHHILLNPTLHLVLDRPRIAGNIAAIVRLAVATQCALHVCGPLVFDPKDKTKWRAGLDYFFGARVHFHLSLSRCLRLLNKPPWLLEVGGEHAPWEIRLEPSDVVVLGPETSSIEQAVIEEYPGRIITLPQLGPVRSLNLAQCAAVICFEALRQHAALRI